MKKKNEYFTEDGLGKKDIREYYEDGQLLDEVWGNKLTTLEGCHQPLTGSFDCNNNDLTSLEAVLKS